MRHYNQVCADCTLYPAEAERYLKRTKECIVRTPSTTPSLLFASQKFNLQQCKYLAEKLKSTHKRAELFLKPLEKGNFRFLSSEDKASFIEVFKLLYTLAIAVENFIQDCIVKDAWMKTAIFLPNASEHVSLIGFNLELCTLVFQDIKEPNVDDIYNGEVVAVQEKELQDTKALLRTLNERLHSKRATSTEYELAAHLKRRLERSSIDSLESRMLELSLYETDFKSLQRFTEPLGKGAFGTVYKAKWLGVEVAVKTFSEPSFPDFEEEVSILVGLSHPNIMPLLAFARDKLECSIVMELMQGGDLFDLIQSRMRARDYRFPFDILEGVDVMLQIGIGMQYLHEMKVVHRDLKSKNVLVRRMKGSETEYVVAKVADLGSSKMKENSMTYSNLTPNMGSTRWMAPEIIKLENQPEMLDTLVKKGDAVDQKYTRKPDVHSFAMVCYEILTGKQPYSEVYSLNEVKKMISAGERPTLPQQRHCPDMLKRLIESCWHQDPSQRPSFPDICKELRHLKCSLLLACK